MTKVAINGNNLHEIQMRIKCGYKGSISHLSYPEHRIKVNVEKDGMVVLQMPPLLALALYHNIFAKEKKISVNVKNKASGIFKIKDLHYNDELHGDGLVDIFLEQDGGRI